jgi:hypothetical protein
MAMNYRGGAYDAEEENPYAVGGQTQGAPFRRGSYGGSMAANFQREMAPPPVRMVGWQAGEETGERQARIQRDIQSAGEDTVRPVREGFRAAQDGQDSMALEGEAQSKAFGAIGNSALKEQSRYNDSVQQQNLWLHHELQSQEGFREQQQDQQRQQQRQSRGGLFKTIGTIAGSLIGGPGLGAVLG